VTKSPRTSPSMTSGAAAIRYLRKRAAKGVSRRPSPNRQRLIARVAVWAVAVSGAAFMVPHLAA